MLQELSEFPEDLPLLPFSEQEMKRLQPWERRVYFRRSEWTHAMVDENNHTLLVGGIIKPTLVHDPELWVLICEDFKVGLAGNLKNAKLHFEELLREYPDIIIRVDAAAPLGTKFAEFFGFREYSREERDGREFILLRVK